jgi:branched-chain amino acid transport system permease protein
MKKRDWKKTGWRLLQAVGLIYLFLLISPVAGLDIPRIVNTITTQPELVLRYLWIGIANGGIFAIVALGYTMVYGIIQLINFAHGDVYMMSTFMALTVIAALGATNKSDPGTIVITLLITIVVTVLFGGTLNAAIERVAYRRLRNAPRLAPLISAIGVSLILQNLGQVWAGQGYIEFLKPYFGTSGGAAQKAFPDLMGSVDLIEWVTRALGMQPIPLKIFTKEVFVVVAAIALMVALRLFVQRTRLGKAMRATAENRDAAKIMGINIDRIIAITFFIGGALAGVAALLNGLYVNTAWWLMGFQAGLRSFTAAVLGGIGNITGAMLGGFIIGILTSLSDGLLDPAWTRAWVFAVLVLVLIFRPNGLLGSNVSQKA